MTRVTPLCLEGLEGLEGRGVCGVCDVGGGKVKHTHAHARACCIPLPWCTSQSTMATRDTPSCASASRAATHALLKKQKPGWGWGWGRARAVGEACTGCWGGRSIYIPIRTGADHVWDVWVWTYGCMDVWVHGRMGAWTYGCPYGSAPGAG
jgi:hypothetical protein